MTPSNTTRPGWLKEKDPLEGTLPDDYREKKTREGPAGLDLGDLLKEQQFRKLNRIAGYLEKRSADVPEVVPVSQALNRALQKEADLAKTSGKGNANAEWHEVQTAMKDASKTQLPKGATEGKSAQENKVESWQKFSAISTMGTLNRWAKPEGQSNEIDSNLRAMRQTMVARENQSIVLHRGAGPTNRTMGGLINQKDFRRADMPAENSPEAFNSAYQKMPPKVGRDKGVDGVESDVFLSQDKKAILSHEGAVMEQLSDDRKDHERGKPDGIINDKSHIDSVSHEDLTATQRTHAPDSRFQTLSQFLDSTREPGRQYFEATQEAMRVEIEMKGKRHVEGKEGKATKKAGNENYKQTLISQVGKDISQFNKAKEKEGDPTPHEVVMFNNDADDAQKFAELRNFKTRLGTVYTGMGGNLKTSDPNLSSQENEDILTKQDTRLATVKPHVDELRTSVANMHAVNEVAALKDFKVTLVSSGDRTVGQTGETHKERLDFGAEDPNPAEIQRRETANKNWMHPESEVDRMGEAAQIAAHHPKVGLLIDDGTKAAQYRQQAQLSKEQASGGLSHDRTRAPAEREKT